MSRRIVGAVLGAILLLLPAPALAATDAYQGDPLDLIAYADQVRVYSSGVDTWDVWVCDVPDGTLALDPSSIAQTFRAELVPYFQWLSGSRYRPEFRAGGVVEAQFASGWPDNPLARQLECEQLVLAEAAASANGAIVITTADYDGGYATPGLVCEVAGDCPTSFPDNGRLAVLGGGTVPLTGSAGALRVVAHEIGHGLAMPHSFGGLTTFLGGIVYEYDNPMDVMSGGDAVSLDVGTIAINRYAAGWIDTASFHRGGSFAYVLDPDSFLVLPTDAGAGVFDVLSARTRNAFDAGIPVEGVEVYAVDQRGEACGLVAGEVCFGVDRRTTPTPAVSGSSSTAHVHPVGSVFSIRGVEVEVVSREGESFLVRVTGAPVSERFVDDDGNLHEPAIETIAGLGVTLGCSPPTNERYCPARQVTRAEMAAFLLRAVGEEPAPSASAGFPDVPVDAWYAPYVDRLAELGITSGYEDGTFRPGRAVTRAEMAVFLVRTFEALLEVQDAEPVFDDVAAEDWYAAAVEGIRRAGVTLGCDVDRYCPAEPVLRDQMASFLDRAIATP